MNITLPSWLDMDQPVEAAVAAIVLFLVAGFFLRRRDTEPPAPQPSAPPPPQAPLATAPIAPPTTPARTVNPTFQEYLDFVAGLGPNGMEASEGVPRAAHWSD